MNKKTCGNRSRVGVDLAPFQPEQFLQLLGLLKLEFLKDAMSTRPTIHLQKGFERRLLKGHEWIFSNELKPVSQKLQPGTEVQVVSHQGKPLGVAHYNPRPLIAGRMLARFPADLEPNWIEERVRRAVTLRDQWIGSPHYRAVFGESDGLPGLVVDRFGDYLTVQITTAGMERERERIQAALQEHLQPLGILWRADDRFREMEGLAVGESLVTGIIPDEVELREGSRKFRTNLLAGQKTGWFFDQRDNRLRLARYLPRGEMLDVFSYAGAWAVHGLAAGATAATCVDSSELALELARANARLNDQQLETLAGDAFEVLRGLLRNGQRYRSVVIDPPALIKRKKDYEAGLQAYYQLNRLAIQLIGPEGGLLVTCSCSQHLPWEDLHEVVRHSALQFRRTARILERGSQSCDHPLHPALPEMEYLKALFVWID